LLPTLSHLSVSIFPDRRLRHWCSSRYLRISPLHREFRDPLKYSSSAVSDALPWLSRGISHPTCQAAYARFTPNNSEQRLHPSYYRGCWHEVSRCFLWRYRQSTGLLTQCIFVPPDRALQPEGLLHSRSVADHPLRPATDHRLGGPLPHQLANQTQAHPRTKGIAPSLSRKTQLRIPS